MTSRRLAIAKRVAFGLGAFLVIAGVLLAFLTYQPKRNRYLIPEGYAGWLCVTFEAPRTPPLPIEDGFAVVRFPADGRVVTSTVAEGGKLRDEFYYYISDRRKPFDVARSLGGGYSLGGGSNPPGVTYKFWVSPNARVDYLRFVANKPDTCGPFAGYTSSNMLIDTDTQQYEAASQQLLRAGHRQR
jgi:hypothetical protein